MFKEILLVTLSVALVLCFPSDDYLTDEYLSDDYPSNDSSEKVSMTDESQPNIIDAAFHKIGDYGEFLIRTAL